MRKKLRKDSEDVPFVQTLCSVRKYPGHLPYLINFATKKSSKTQNATYKSARCIFFFTCDVNNFADVSNFYILPQT